MADSHACYFGTGLCRPEAKEEVRCGQVSIVDPPGDLTFTVTLENLTAADAGKYRCEVTMILQEGLLGFLPEPFFQGSGDCFPG